MSSRSVLGFIYTLQGLQSLGCDISTVKSRFGIDIDRLSPEAEIERSLELTIYDALKPQEVDPLAGIKIGRTVSLAGYGPFTMLLMTCENAWHGFRTGVEFQSLTYLYGHLSLELGESTTLLALDPVPLPKGCARFVWDRDFSGTFQLIRDMQTHTGLIGEPVALSFPYPKPKQVSYYQKRFDCALRFDAKRFSIELNNKDMSRPFPGYNATAHALYRNQCLELLSKRQQEQDNLAGKVVDHLRLFVDRYPNAEEVAMTFGMAERTFRRGLQQEQTSFRKLLDQVKLETAQRLLKDRSLSVEQVADKLGYAESAAFIRAFQRWTGKSPSAYRQQDASS